MTSRVVPFGLRTFSRIRLSVMDDHDLNKYSELIKYEMILLGVKGVLVIVYLSHAEVSSLCCGYLPCFSMIAPDFIAIILRSFFIHDLYIVVQSITFCCQFSLSVVCFLPSRNHFDFAKLLACLCYGYTS